MKINKFSQLFSSNTFMGIYSIKKIAFLSLICYTNG